MMFSELALPRRVMPLLAAVSLVLASFAPLLISGNASAGQLTERKITLSSSQTSTSNTYTASFKVAAATSTLGIVVDICDSPLVGIACTSVAGVVTPVAGTVSVSDNTGTTQTVAFNVDVDTVGTDSTATGRTLLTHATGLTNLAIGDSVTFSYTVTNPSATGTYYARILTFATEAAVDAYVGTATTGFIDSGSIALSTANQLTVSARVQEQLQFCIGTTTVDDATTALSTDCGVAFTGSAGNSVNMGVLDNAAVYVSGPANAATADNGVNGAAMVRTNAANGIAVSFYPEAGSGTNHTRALRVTGVTCSADAFPSTDTTDQCFNSAASTQAAFSAGTEKFGMTIAGTNCGSTTAYTCVFASSSNKIAAGAEWNGSGAGTYGTAGGFAWHENATATTIATSTSVVDDEVLLIKFAGTASITTPTGQYGVTSTYIATATF